MEKLKRYPKLFALHSNPQQLYAYDKLDLISKKDFLNKLHALVDIAGRVDWLQQDLAKKMRVDSDIVYDRFNAIEEIISDAQDIIDELSGYSIDCDYSEINVKAYNELSLTKKLELLINTCQNLDFLQQKLSDDMGVDGEECLDRHIMIDALIDDAQEVLDNG